MGGIFISYSRVDRPTTERLAHHLRRIYGHHNVWFDENLRGGQMWWDEIRRQIMHNEVFIILISIDSLESKYCMMELDEARALSKRIIPILVRARTTVPPEIKSLHMVNMSQGINVDNLTELQAAINYPQDEAEDVEEADITQRARAGEQTLPARISLIPTRPAPAKPPRLTPPPAPPPARFPVRLIIGVGLVVVGVLVAAALGVLHTRNIPQAAPVVATVAVANPVVPQFTLLYDEDTLTLINTTKTRLNATDLYFIRETGIDFHSSSWQDGRPLGELAPGECVQLWTMAVRYLPPPANCTRLHWRQVSQQHVFWHGAFNVLQAGEDVAFCSTEAGRCHVPATP